MIRRIRQVAPMCVVCVCACVQAFVRTSAMNATRRSHSAVRSSRDDPSYSPGGANVWCVCVCAGVRPYQCDECNKAFTQRCSLESHCRKVHGRDFHFAHKQRRDKVCLSVSHSVSPLVSRNVRRILVSGVNAPLPPVAKKILKI